LLIQTSVFQRTRGITRLMLNSKQSDNAYGFVAP
jgi:hypothetical protein